MAIQKQVLGLDTLHLVYAVLTLEGEQVAIQK